LQILLREFLRVRRVGVNFCITKQVSPSTTVHFHFLDLSFPELVFLPPSDALYCGAMEEVPSFLGGHHVVPETPCSSSSSWIVIDESEYKVKLLRFLFKTADCSSEDVSLS